MPPTGLALASVWRRMRLAAEFLVHRRATEIHERSADFNRAPDPPVRIADELAQTTRAIV